MAKGKYAKKKAPFVDIYGVLLLIATLAMSIAYAEIVGTEITISTKAEATAQEGVFITDVICNESNSVSNNYMATTLDSSITLDSPTDTKNFTITIYNKTLKPYVFVGVKKLDKWDEFTGVYNNTNISYTFGNDMIPHETIVQPKDWIVFNVDLGFNGQGEMPETLRSLLNFSFQEIPTLEIVSEDTIDNMYPNCEEKVYEFTVSNQRQDAEHGLITNGVPLTYTISPNVPAPLTAKIYDEDGVEVVSNKAITISSEAKEEQTYTMKVKWDNTNPVDGTPYNSASYAGQTLASTIEIIATPEIIDDNDRYIGYTLNKAEPVEIKTEPLYFDITTDKTTVEMNNTTNAENIMLTIKNNDGAEKINSFPVEYKLSIDNSKFTLYVNGNEVGEQPLTLGNTATISQEHEIQLVTKDEQELEATENCNLSIEAISPYAKTETIELTITDTTGPTAPIINGGSTGEYALTQTISVSEVSTDVGTGVGKYQYLLNSTESTETTSIADVTTTATSQTFTEDAPGYYVYFRAVDNAGNVGEWSNAQQIYIDTQKPTVTPKQASVTITEGENYNLADYFTVTPNGTNTNYTTECTIDGTVYETTENIPAGTYTVTCTATITGGNSNSTTMELIVWEVGETLSATDVANNAKTYYGVEVEGYTCENSAGVNKWLIFHSDGDNIYMIADDYIHYDYVPADRQETKPNGDEYKIWFSNVYAHYDGSSNILDTSITDPRIQKWIDYAVTYPTANNTNIKSVAYLLDSNVWSVYKNSIYADYAIGGPTVELFAESYNKLYDLNIGYNHAFDYGYKVGTGGASGSNSITGLDISNQLYINDATSNRTVGYWLASPSTRVSTEGYVIALMNVGYEGGVFNNWYGRNDLGLRPVVCLKEGITLETLEQGKAKLVLPVTMATSIQTETTEYKDAKGNKIVVPGGFKVRTDLATTVDKGIVIEDSTGDNQFVWVPIGEVTRSDGDTVNIEFGRYSDFSLTANPAQYAKDNGWNADVPKGDIFSELTAYRESLFASEMENSNATAKDLQGFITNAIENGGYYIARYEASFGSGNQISSVTNGTTSVGTKAITNQVPYFNQSTSASSSSDMSTVTSTPGMLWNYIRQGDASLACQNLYAGNEYNGKSYVECDLVNSYAWDTAIMFIQLCSDKTDYANQTRLNRNLYNTGTDTGKTTDIACNIYDMAGNLYEWTTEYSSDSFGDGWESCVRRGGTYYDSDMCTMAMLSTSATISHGSVGFRSVLTVPYVVQVNANEDTLEVTEGESNNSFDSLFTVTTKDGGTATKTYTLNGASTSYTNTSELAVGTHTITCTATYNGVSDTAYMTVVVKEAEPSEETLLVDLGQYGDSATTFTVPAGVTCLKLVAELTSTFGQLGDIVCGGCDNYITTSYGTESVMYVEVEPGETYTWKYDGDCYTGKLYYSSTINSTTPDYIAEDGCTCGDLSRPEA